jgi:hypothetical protein
LGVDRLIVTKRMTGLEPQTSKNALRPLFPFRHSIGVASSSGIVAGRSVARTDQAAPGTRRRPLARRNNRDVGLSLPMQFSASVRMSRRDEICVIAMPQSSRNRCVKLLPQDRSRILHDRYNTIYRKHLEHLNRAMSVFDKVVLRNEANWPGHRGHKHRATGRFAKRSRMLSFAMSPSGPGSGRRSLGGSGATRVGRNVWTFRSWARGPAFDGERNPYRSRLAGRRRRTKPRESGGHLSRPVARVAWKMRGRHNESIRSGIHVPGADEMGATTLFGLAPWSESSPVHPRLRNRRTGAERAGGGSLEG